MKIGHLEICPIGLNGQNLNEHAKFYRFSYYYIIATFLFWSLGQCMVCVSKELDGMKYVIMRSVLLNPRYMCE